MPAPSPTLAAGDLRPNNTRHRPHLLPLAVDSTLPRNDRRSRCTNLNNARMPVISQGGNRFFNHVRSRLFYSPLCDNSDTCDNSDMCVITRILTVFLLMAGHKDVNFTHQQEHLDWRNGWSRKSLPSPHLLPCFYYHLVSILSKDPTR